MTKTINRVWERPLVVAIASERQNDLHDFSTKQIVFRNVVLSLPIASFLLIQTTVTPKNGM